MEEGNKSGEEKSRLKNSSSKHTEDEKTRDSETAAKERKDKEEEQKLKATRIMRYDEVSVSMCPIILSRLCANVILDLTIDPTLGSSSKPLNRRRTATRNPF